MRNRALILALMLPAAGCIDSLAPPPEDLEPAQAPAALPSDPPAANETAPQAPAGPPEPPAPNATAPAPEEPVEPPAPEPPKPLRLTFVGAATGVQGVCPPDVAECAPPRHAVAVPGWAARMRVTLTWVHAETPAGPEPADLDPVLLAPGWCSNSTVNDQSTSDLCRQVAPRADQPVVPADGVFANRNGTPAEPDAPAVLELAAPAEGEWILMVWPKLARELAYEAEVIIEP